MRIVHCDAGRSLRGGQWQALYLVEGLRAAGEEVLLLARRGAPLAAEARRRGLPVQPLTAWRLWRESRAADLVHAHDARAHTLAALVSQCPCVVARRVAFPVRTGPWSRWKYKRAAHYLAISACVAGQLRCAGVDAGRIAIVPDGVPPLAEACGVRLLALDTDDPRKGSRLAAAAAARAGLELTFSRDLMQDLAGARVFLYLSEQEGLGSAILLAMAAGVPVVASRVGGIPEIVEHGVTGLLVENDLATVAAALRQLWDNPEMRLKMGKAARRRVAERYTLAHLVERTRQVYRQVLAV